MHGIIIRYNVSEELTVDQWPKKMDAFAYVQRSKPHTDEKTLSLDELRDHAIRYIKSLKENASEHLVEHRNGEIEHFDRRYTESLKSKENMEAQLINLEEILLLLKSMSALNLSHAFVENSGKLLRQLSPYANDAGHPTFQTTRVERHFYTELIEHIEVVHARILRMHNPSTIEMQHNEKLWTSVCEQLIEKVEARIERFLSVKLKHEEKLLELHQLKQQNVEAKERLDHAVNELEQILEALES
ncbi:hypothetical protein AEA09_12000 [Lysinibacillus contaminans]|uniref:Uncharacterized protein n=1 Tax=Lysinibacillus contaminans TaxID=1293441 RepID=A0ABR5K2V1_9BACI|nr:hypothetical protein [Lysinibacillus contaminans]KOS69199.1 hypothetical protein AEA09_12000 [Lysinibacillus contaminans]